MDTQQLKSVFSFNQGVNKIHYTLLAVFVIFILFFISSDGEEEQIIEHEDMITPAILKEVYSQNLDKPDEYAEAGPILKSMEKHLYLFEVALEEDPLKADGYLLTVRRRFLYLRNKGLEVSKAEKLLDDYLEKIDKEKK